MNPSKFMLFKLGIQTQEDLQGALSSGYVIPLPSRSGQNSRGQPGSYFMDRFLPLAAEPIQVAAQQVRLKCSAVGVGVEAEAAEAQEESMMRFWLPAPRALITEVETTHHAADGLKKVFDGDHSHLRSFVSRFMPALKTQKGTAGSVSGSGSVQKSILAIDNLHAAAVLSTAGSRILGSTEFLESGDGAKTTLLKVCVPLSLGASLISSCARSATTQSQAAMLQYFWNLMASDAVGVTVAVVHVEVKLEVLDGAVDLEAMRKAKINSYKKYKRDLQLSVNLVPLD
jgi:hypothetical protein